MTRHLRMAGVGLCAVLLPACSMFNEPSEIAPPVSGQGYVVLPRRPVGSPSVPQDPGAGAAAAPNVTATAAAPTIAAKPPTDLPMPAIPAMPATSAKTNPAVVSPPAPADPAPQLAVKVPVSPPPPAPPDEPVRQPEWPQLGQPAGAPRPSAQPEAAPKIEPASATVPAPTIAPAQEAVPAPAQATAPEPGWPSLPPPAPAAPNVVRAPEASTSMKMPASPNMAMPPSADSLAPTGADTVLFRALRAFQNNRPQEAVEHLRRLDPANQELLMYLMPLMVRLAEGDTSALPPEELAVLIDRLQTASSTLKSKATLRAERVCFCRGVRRFADLDIYEAGHEFRVGDMVFLYAELKNFTCEPVAAPAGATAPARSWQIHLGTKLELRDVRNNVIWRTDLNKNDVAQAPPQDYYHTYRFFVPDKLPPGTYTLWLTIVDKPTGRIVRKPVEMRIGQS